MLQSQILKMVQGRLLSQHLPVALELWNGEALQPAGPATVTLRINKPQALFDLIKPSLGKLAKGYVQLT